MNKSRPQSRMEFQDTEILAKKARADFDFSENKSRAQSRVEFQDTEIPTKKTRTDFAFSMNNSRAQSIMEFQDTEILPEKTLVPLHEQMLTPGHIEQKFLFDSHCHLDRIYSQAFKKQASSFYHKNSNPLERLKGLQF